MPHNTSKLSVIVPYYNEEATVVRIIRELCALDMVAEVIAVDDGSTDNSYKALQVLNSPKIKHRRLPANRGKAGAVAYGIKAASQDWILIQDADLEYSPGDIPLLWQATGTADADAIFGSRFLHSGKNPAGVAQLFANRLLTRLFNFANKANLTDLETGYKCFRSELVDGYNFRSRGFGLEVELGTLLARTNGGIKEVPISYAPRNRAQGKKIRFKDGVMALWYILLFARVFSTQGEV